MNNILTDKDINLMIFRYLQDSGFEHTAFNFGHETGINTIPIDRNSVPGGALVTVIQKGLQHLELEANLSNNNTDVDEDFRFIGPVDLITKDVNELRRMVQEEIKGTGWDGDRVENEKESENRGKGGKNDNSREGDTGQQPLGVSSASTSNACHEPSSEVLVLEGHTSRVCRCAWSPTGSILASGSEDSTARIWRIPDGSRGSSLQTRLDKSVVLVHPKFRRRKNSVLMLDWNDKGTRLATGSYDGKARIWNVQGNLISTLEKHKGPIFALKWNMKGDYLLTGSDDKSAILWDMVSNEFDRQFDVHKGQVLDVDWRDVESFATSSSDTVIRVFRIGRSRPIKTFAGHQAAVNCIKWNPYGSLLASCSADTTVKIWSMNHDKCVHDLREHSKKMCTIRWSPTQEPLLVSASFDSTVNLWDTSAGKLLYTLEEHRDRVDTVAFSHDGRYLATGSMDGSLCISSMKDIQVVKKYTGNGSILEVCWNKEGDKIACCSNDGEVCVLDFRM